MSTQPQRRRAQLEEQQRELEDRVLARAAQLDPNDHSLDGERVRETAESIREHREMAAKREVWAAADALGVHAAPSPSGETLTARGLTRTEWYQAQATYLRRLGEKLQRGEIDPEAVAFDAGASPDAARWTPGQAAGTGNQGMWIPELAEDQRTDDRETSSPSPASGAMQGSNHMDGGFPLATAAAEVNTAAASYEPGDMWTVAADIKQLPEVFASVALGLRTYAARLEGGYALAQPVVQELQALYVGLTQLAQHAQEVEPLFRSVHAEDLRRGENPRVGESGWNV